jgi:hypothetical protein
MTHFSKTLNNKNKKKYNLTRKKSSSIKSNYYSEGFVRRMNAPISFTIVNISDSKKNELDKKIGPILSDDEKWELYVNGY